MYAYTHVSMSLYKSINRSHCKMISDRIKLPAVKYIQFPVFISLYDRYDSRIIPFNRKLYLHAPKIQLLTGITNLFNPDKTPNFDLRSVLALPSHSHLGFTLVGILSGAEQNMPILGGLKELNGSSSWDSVRDAINKFGLRIACSIMIHISLCLLTTRLLYTDKTESQKSCVNGRSGVRSKNLQMSGKDLHKNDSKGERVLLMLYILPTSTRT